MDSEDDDSIGDRLYAEMLGMVVLVTCFIVPSIKKPLCPLSKKEQLPLQQPKRGQIELTCADVIGPSESDTSAWLSLFADKAANLHGKDDIIEGSCSTKTQGVL